MHQADVVVIGGGIAGVAAALAARREGAAVTLVRAGPGATALSGGGWRGALPAFGEALERAGHPLEPCGLAVADVSGRLALAAATPPWHRPAPLDGGTLVCGIVGLPTFLAPFLARAWGSTAVASAAAPGSENAAGGPGAGDRPGSASLELPGTPAGGWSPVALAAAVERAPERLGEALGRLARERGAVRVLLPACLGLDEPRQTWTRVQEASGVGVSEAVGGLPSLPGWRLDAALLRALAAAGVERRDERVTGAVRAGERVAALRLAGGGELRPGAVLLATGKYLGGGVLGAPALAEPALGLEVVLERLGTRFPGAPPLLTTELARAGDQPLLRAGVRADSRGRPLVAPGWAAAPRNVLVAGSLREGWDAALSGLGAAAADGWAIGLAALEAA